MISTYLTSLLGGLLIGLSASLFFLFNGRIAGISGIVGGLFASPSRRWGSNFLFVAGLVLGPVVFHLVFGAWPVVRLQGALVTTIAAGLLVGFGTRLGSGCTSGHGVCGLARLSPRSAVAVAAFLSTGIATVALMHAVTP